MINAQQRDDMIKHVDRSIGVLVNADPQQDSESIRDEVIEIAYMLRDLLSDALLIKPDEGPDGSRPKP